MCRWNGSNSNYKCIQKMQQAVKYNLYIKYEKLIELDLDIDLVLEYRINSKRLINIQADWYTKYGN